VNTAPPYVGSKVQMFLNRPDQEAPDWCCGTDSTEGTFITYWSFVNQNTSVWVSLLQRLFRCWKHLRQSARCICISCCVALLLIGLHLQTLYRSECLRLETGQTLMTQCEGSCVVYSTVERGVRPTLAAQGRAMEVCDCDLPRNRPPFLGHCGELLHAEFSLLLIEMMLHSSTLCSALKAEDTFGTQSESFRTRSRFSKIKKWHIQCTADASHFTINWQSSVSCADSTEIRMISLAFREFEHRTPIRFRERDPLSDTDHIHITRYNSGCWSYVGRQGGVSNKVHCVVKTNPARRTAQIWVCNSNLNTQIYSDFTHILTPSNSCDKTGTVVSDL